MTDWITDRTPTKDDADREGEVIVCISPRLLKNEVRFEKWYDVTFGWPWRHASPPSRTPEPTPAAPKFRVGQVWRTRNGQICQITKIYNNNITDSPIETDLYGFHTYNLNGVSCLAINGQDHEDDLVELISENPPTPVAPEPEPEPEKAARGFLQYTRTTYIRGHAETAVGTDHTAWFRFIGVNCSGKWQQVDSLPQPGEE